jgi:hypothetical protein
MDEVGSNSADARQGGFMHPMLGGLPIIESISIAFVYISRAKK